MKRPKTHKPSRAKTRTHRRRFDGGWYGRKAWRQARASCLSRQPWCEACELEGRTTPATEVHHRIPRRARPDLAFEPSNLASLCKSCHSRETAAETLNASPPGGPTYDRRG